MVEINYFWLAVAIGGGMLMENIAAGLLSVGIKAYYRRKLQPILDKQRKEHEEAMNKWLDAMAPPKDEFDGQPPSSALPN